MPAGKAGDRVEAFLLQGDQVVPQKTNQEGPWLFHYGDHSNHPTMKLARARQRTALLTGNQLVVYSNGKDAQSLRVPSKDPDASLSLAVDGDGLGVDVLRSAHLVAFAFDLAGERFAGLGRCGGHCRSPGETGWGRNRGERRANGASYIGSLMTCFSTYQYWPVAAFSFCRTRLLLPMATYSP